MFLLKEYLIKLNSFRLKWFRSSGENLTLENKALLNDAQNSNTQFENAPHIGPVTEDSENNIR